MKKSLLSIFVLSICVTIIFQFNLTRALLFENYFSTDQNIAGNGLYLDEMIESAKGSWRLGSPYIKEMRDEPYLYIPLNIHVAGMIKWAFHLNAKTASIVVLYAAPLVMTFLTFLFFLVLFQWHWFGSIAAFVYLFLPGMRSWADLISPPLNFIFLFLFLIFYVSRFSFWKREVGLAVTAGLLFYTYPYHWTYALLILIFFDIWHGIKIQKVEYSRIVKYLIICFIATIYIWNLLTIIRLPYYTETMRRIGLIYSRFPAGLATQTVILGLLAAVPVFYRFYYRKLKDRRAMHLFDFDKIIIGLMAGIAVLNQQFITGMELEFNSHYYAVIMIFVVALIGGISWVVIVDSNSIRVRQQINNSYLFPLDGVKKQFFARMLFVLWFIVTSTFVGRWVYIQTKQNDFYSSGNYWSDDALTVAKWFQKNNIHDAVVYAPIELMDPIHIISENYFVFHPNQALFLISNQELIDRFSYFDISNQKLTNNLADYQNMVFGHAFDAQLQKDNIVGRIKSIIFRSQFVPASLNDYVDYDFNVLQKKRESITKSEFIKYLSRYHVDYLIYPIESIKHNSSLIVGTKVFETKNYIITLY